MVRPRANCPPDGMSERVVVERMPSDPSFFNSWHHRGDSGHQPDPIVFSLLLRPIIMAGPRGKDLRGKKKVRPCECQRELNCGCAHRVCAAARGHECNAVLMDDIFFHLAGGEMSLFVFYKASGLKGPQFNSAGGAAQNPSSASCLYSKKRQRRQEGDGLGRG